MNNTTDPRRSDYDGLHDTREPDQSSNSASSAGCIADSQSVVADYVAFCTDCNGWVGVADASTPEAKKEHKSDVAIWADEGYRVELIEHGPKDQMPPECTC